MLKIDAHHHFWDLEKIAVPWLTGAPERAPLLQNFLPGQFEPLLQARQVNGTVVIQAAASEAETDWLLELSKSHPFIKGVVGWVDLTAADLADRLARFKSLGPYCGTRYFLVNEVAGKASLDPAALPGLKTLAEQDLACDLIIPASQLGLFLDLFAAIPQGRWVINHLGLPDLKAGGFNQWQADMRQLAAYPNVFCKASGFIALADRARDVAEQSRQCFETVLEIFGPNRLMYGSDWPVCLLSAESYFEVHDLFASLVAPLSPTEQAAIWAGTALEAYKIEG